MSDPQVPWRWIQVYGTPVAAQVAPGVGHAGRLSRRYTGHGFRGNLDARCSFKTKITGVKGGDGSPQAAWDVTTASTPPA